jgi:hypothetical protein
VLTLATRLGTHGAQQRLVGRRGQIRLRRRDGWLSQSERGGVARPLSARAVQAGLFRVVRGRQRGHQALWSHRQVAALARFGHQRGSQTRRTSVAPDPQRVPLSTSERPRESQHRSACLAASTYNARTHNLCIRSSRSENDPRPSQGRSPVWRAHMALVPLPTCRDATQASMWAKPCLAATTYNARGASHVPRATPNSTHGRSPVWRADPRRSYERSVARRTPRVAARLGWSFLITP